MSSPIGFREFSEDEHRKFIRTLSDQELIKAGKRLRILCGNVVLTTTFDRQLKLCREEYRRRHPKWFNLALRTFGGRQSRTRKLARIRLLPHLNPDVRTRDAPRRARTNYVAVNTTARRSGWSGFSCRHVSWRHVPFAHGSEYRTGVSPSVTRTRRLQVSA